ncbi:hypothetical protein [Paracraurococcus lichenis]|uniref:Uncharacterized protein n=1 Tax=Paracraurococcus lichenis TaxID=3064888 RepID=A0ABT9E6U7_9PROT|nr:hypothetical protein [Paracraurococcus sp. LOR1-02]MDO9711879.1 hypothetical protein [Paracraurococcus sp. LOR1-02]
METAPRDGAVLCLSDGTAMITGAWDGTEWVLYPDAEAGSVDPRHFVPRLWMRVTFAASLPGGLPDDTAPGIIGL